MRYLDAVKTQRICESFSPAFETPQLNGEGRWQVAEQIEVLRGKLRVGSKVTLK
jgi:hypothetical protein